jgi:phage/plasmid-associated DNA primase
LQANEIDIEDLLPVFGSLLHKRQYLRDIPVPILKGVPGAGKSLLISYYVDLIGLENVATLSKSKTFKFENFIEKQLGNLEDMDPNDIKSEDLKNMFEGVSMIVDRKYKSMIKVSVPRFVGSTNIGLDVYRDEDKQALLDRCVIYCFKEPLKDNDLIKKISIEMPSLIINANKAFMINRNKKKLFLKIQNKYNL